MKEDTTRYHLQSLFSGKEFSDSGWLLEAQGEEKPALIRAIYAARQLNPGDSSMGLYRFADWLPVHRHLKGSSAPVTYHSGGLGAKLGLSRLFITFSSCFFRAWMVVRALAP